MGEVYFDIVATFFRGGRWHCGSRLCKLGVPGFLSANCQGLSALGPSVFPLVLIQWLHPPRRRKAAAPRVNVARHRHDDLAPTGLVCVPSVATACIASLAVGVWPIGMFTWCIGSTCRVLSQLGKVRAASATMA